jgi:membrane protease YdiL (CAAX protease family)
MMSDGGPPPVSMRVVECPACNAPRQVPARRSVRVRCNACGEPYIADADLGTGEFEVLRNAPPPGKRTRVLSPEMQAAYTAMPIIAVAYAVDLLAIWSIWSDNPKHDLVISSVASAIVVGITAAILAKMLKPSMGSPRQGVGVIGIAALSGIVSYLLATVWVAVISPILPEHVAEMEDLFGVVSKPMQVLLVAVFPAMFEELFFRGIAMEPLRRIMGPTMALVVTSVTFAFVHLSPLVLPVHLGLGFVLGWMRLKTGSLWPGVALHFAHNFLVVLDPAG